MKRTGTIVVIAAIIFASCQTAPSQQGERIAHRSFADEFTGTTFEEMRFRTHFDRFYRGGGHYDLTFRHYEAGQMAAVSYRGEGWMFIESLIFLVDGEPMAPDFARASSDREVRTGGNASEWAVFPLTDEQTQRLVTAQSIRYRASGARGMVEGELDEADRAELRRFFAGRQS